MCTRQFRFSAVAFTFRHCSEMSGDFYSYLNSHNLTPQKQPQEVTSVVSIPNTDDETPKFSEAAMREFAKKWLGEQGCECGLSEETGFRPSNGAVIVVEGIPEEDRDYVGNLMQDLIDAIEERFGEYATFTKSNELPSYEDEFGGDGVRNGTYKATVSYDFHPYGDEEEDSKPKGDDEDEYARNIALLKSSGAI